MGKLGAYQKKRDFQKTAEPPPKEEKGLESLFVVQKHAATRLHYDFRLAVDGVLASWAVPKGIPYRKGEKRLAVHVEDHPMSYAEFEGIIPAGEYGGGTVMVWDIGSYKLLGGTPAKALKEGKLHLLLHGTKLKGEWTLVRSTPATEDEKELWLLMKTGASVRPVGKLRDDRSALTERTMRQIAQEKAAVWSSNRKAAVFIAPMSPTLVKRLPEGAAWSYELKFDGYRAIAVKRGAEVCLFSRNEQRLDFPSLVAAVGRLPCENAVLDGEVVALDAEGRPTFQLLQHGNSREKVIQYYLFDLLMLDGESLLSRPLSERRMRLERLLKGAGGPLLYSASLPGTAEAVLRQIRRLHLEGAVAKHLDAPYTPGLRTKEWVKVKCLNEQEFVIGGYTVGNRLHLGALLVGTYERGGLRYAGKVGTGFSEADLRMLKKTLVPLEQTNAPFVSLPLTAAEKKGCIWVQPHFVCQIKFTEWTRDHRLRHPVYLGLRHDKVAKEVMREA